MHARWSALGASEPPDHAPALYGHSLTSFSEAVGACVVCFGGTTGEGVNSQTNSVWTWREAEGWREALVNGQKPPPRGWHGAAQLDDKLYVFGGNRWHQAPGTPKPTRQVFDDFWELNLRTWTWRELACALPAAQRPPPRSACGMATSEDHVLVYGGKNAATDGSAYLGDLWAFAVTQRTWLLVSEHTSKGPVPRALPTFVSTPLGCFLYGGTGASRLPLCDLWHLQRTDDASAGAFAALWAHCKCMPMCPVEHTVAAEDKASTRSTHAGERVAVGHDAHASALTSDTLLVVWSGLMGRMPKRGMLASMPPAPHLTGNLFALDLANINHGWAMLPARGVQADSGVSPVSPRKWAAMTSLAPGKLLVHGGFAGKAVSADAHVLEVQAGGGSHGGHKRHPSLSAESSAMRDSVANERNGASPAGQSSAVDGSSGVDNATAAESSGAAGASSPARQEAAPQQAHDKRRDRNRRGGHGPAGFQSMFSSVFGGMYKGMENISTEAVSAIQKVATPGAGSPSAGEPAATSAASSPSAELRQEPPPPQQIKYSSRASASALSDHGASSSSRDGRSAAHIAEWLLTHASAANLDGIRVLVPTSDCLSTERGVAATPKRRSKYRARGGARAAEASTPELRAPGGHKRSFGDAGLAEPPGREHAGSVEALALPDDDEHEDSGSPVSLWISPAGPSGHTAWDLPQLQGAEYTEVCDVLDHLVAAVAAHEDGEEAAGALQRRGSLEGTSSFQFSSPTPVSETDGDIDVWPLGGATLDSCVPRVPDERAATSLPLDSRGSTAGAPRVPNASGPPQEESTPKELQTAYVQDMLAIDPVVALGLRVASRPPATLEYVSIDEARADLRQHACAWLRTVPSATCLRCKDIPALLTEYKRIAPAALLHPRSVNAGLATLLHVSLEQLRLRDLDRILSEYAQLADLAAASGIAMRPVRGSA